MDIGVLRDSDVKPHSNTLAAALGKTFAFYTELSAMTQSYKVDWTFTRSVGWMQKTGDKKKSLYYLIPSNEAFVVRMTVREKEKESLLQNTLVNFIHEALANAKKYSEGYFVEFVVTDAHSFKELQFFIAEVMKLR